MSKKLLMWIACGVAVAWLPFGAVISELYTGAASGSSAQFTATMFTSPAIVGALVFLWVYPMFLRRYRGYQMRFSQRYWLAIVATLWILLPIWCNLASWVLRVKGYTALAQILFDYRYLSLFVVMGGSMYLCAVLYFLVQTNLIRSWWHSRVKEFWLGELVAVGVAIKKSREEIKKQEALRPNLQIQSREEKRAYKKWCKEGEYLTVLLSRWRDLCEKLGIPKDCQLIDIKHAS